MSYQDKKDQLKGLLTKSPETPQQKIQPLKNNNLYHLNCWIQNDLARQLKQLALDTNQSIKDITETALKEYLERNESV